MQVRTRLALDVNLSYRLSMLNFLMGKATQQIYTTAGLTSHQWKVLSVLDAFAPMPAREILQWVTLDKAAISRAVQQLRALELANYRPHGTDGRSLDIVLTPKGRHTYGAMNDHAAKLQAQLFARMSSEERKQFFAMIDTLDGRLRTVLSQQSTTRRGGRPSAVD